jgi:hypothetical protein
MLLHFFGFFVVSCGFLKLAFSLLKVAFYGFLHPKNKVHSINVAKKDNS